ncbi:YrhB domain-containing protein [Streptomyces griseoloalbus]|uniref:Immunity protein 35 domain-containing protein n=1 Tax=Streptomyces griseoloalbus TaxID=67303 RepID=A0A7W8FAK5_9ACTN|nr:YrhB domain-containing protein [Streptomyces albaduncus]MBB5128267.1 hypothetical protein [Streptomyces albaduncus]GGW54394.1 hypothetical protein GCM10010340_36230 [Streptomyces albaduncus]
MIERETAVRIVQEELDREEQKWSALGVDVVRAAVARVEEHELVWIVHWQSAEFVRTGQHVEMLIGNGPYLVDRVDGGLHMIGVVSSVSGAWEADYRVRIRGQTIRTAVDELHDELREVASAQGLVESVRTLRQRLTALPPAQALTYVKGLLNGEAPPHLVAVAVERLVVPIDPVLAVTTVRPGESRRTT